MTWRPTLHRAETAVKESLRARWKTIVPQVGRFGVVLATVLMFVFFSILRPASFPTLRNVKTILGTNSVLALVATGALIPLVVGEFDLSVGAILNASAALLASLTGANLSGMQTNLPPFLAVAIVMAVGIGVGAINGILIVRLDMSSFIATLGSGTVLFGLILFLTGGTSLFLGVKPVVFKIGGGDWLGIPRVIFYALVALAVIWYLLEHTPLGRKLYAVGASAEAAALSGIRVARMKMLAFAISGGLASLAGVLEFGRVGAAHPDSGPQFLLPALAAGFLGATTIRPGWFNALGMGAAVLFLAVGVAGLQQLGVPFYVEPLFNGSSLLIAVGLSRHLIRRTNI